MIFKLPLRCRITFLVNQKKYVVILNSYYSCPMLEEMFYIFVAVCLVISKGKTTTNIIFKGSWSHRSLKFYERSLTIKIQ